MNAVSLCDAMLGSGLSSVRPASSNSKADIKSDLRLKKCLKRSWSRPATVSTFFTRALALECRACYDTPR